MWVGGGVLMTIVYMFKEKMNDYLNLMFFS